MNQHRTSRVTRFFPQVVIATAAVVVFPVVVVWVMLAEGVIASVWVCLGLALALSLAASAAGSAYWKRRGGHGDVLFSELLLWGWLHRYRAERRLTNSVDLLGLTNTSQGSAPTNESAERTAQILRQMAAALDAQDPYTDGHSRRVAVHAAMIARKMGLPREATAKVRTAAAVHDVGKLRTPPEVLNKAGTLTDAEFDVMKRHVDDGADIVSVMEDPEITAAVRHHHERFDGRGYPDGLIAQQAPVGARIIAVADTFDALTSARPYRTAIAHNRALAIIADVAGTQLDPVAVQAFLRCYSGRRWVLFWTLLAVSPQRAFTAATRTRAGRTHIASAATVVTPAAMAAVVAAAVGSNVRTHGELNFAQGPSPQMTAASNRSSAQRRGGHPRPRGPASSSAKPSSPSARWVVLRVAGAHQLSLKPSADASSGPGSGVGGSTGNGITNRRGSTGKGGRGAPPQRSVTPVSRTPGVPITTLPSTQPVSGNQSMTPAPPGPADGGSTGGTRRGGAGSPAAGGGGHNGNPGTGRGPEVGRGAGGGTTGGSRGAGFGSGGGSGLGGQGPRSKAACKQGGFLSFGFRNQGQCVAWVEHNVLD